MATSTFPAQGGTVDNTSAATFIPEIWSDEIIAEYESNLVLAPLVKKMSMVGKKGDTIHVPKPARGTAHAKVENTAVTIQNEVEGTIPIVVDQHWEYSKLIEDITDVQALPSLRSFYTSDAGYAMAKVIDDFLFGLGRKFGDGNGSSWVHSHSLYVDAANGLSDYAVDTVVPADLFTDAAFRELIKRLDDEDAPGTGRNFVMPPSLRSTLMGIDRYVSADFVNGAPVANGNIGNLYGVNLFVSSNVPVTETAADNAAGGDIRGALFFQQEALTLVEQMGVRSQTQYKQEFLANLFTSDRIFGGEACRPTSGFVVNVNT